MITSSRVFTQNKEPRELNKKHPGKTYLPRFLDQSDINSLKSSVERELADISMYMEQEKQITSKIVPGSLFKGQWDACTDSYPDSNDENSTWDVIVNCGASHEFDGKLWQPGQQLLYLSTSKIYIQRTNPGTDGIKHEVDLLKVSVENAHAKIETNKTAIADTNFAMSEMNTNLTSQVNKNTSSINQTNQTVSDLKTTVATNKTELESKIDKNTANISQTMSTVAKLDGDVTVLESKWTVQADVNGKISGIEMVNDGKKSNFTIQTDRFVVTDGTTTVPPFSIESGKVTMRDVKVYGHVEAGSGSFKGDVKADSGYFKGHVEAASGSFTGAVNATSGTFKGRIEADSGYFNGSLNVQEQGGNVGMKITNQNILMYDQNGRLRVKIGRL